MIDHTEDAKGGGKSPAIAIFIFGKKEYAYAAQHLALTLREHSPNVPVHLWAAPGLPVDPSYYTEVHALDAEWYADGPGALKLNIHAILPKGDWLYLDADMLCLSDIRPELEKLKAHDFALDVRGVGKEGDGIAYTPWATNATIKRVYGLPDDATYFGVQTSWMWIRVESATCERIFDTVDPHAFTVADLKEKWGTSIPDELCFSAALSKLNIHPFSLPISFYGNRNDTVTFAEARAQYKFAVLYGDVRKHRLVSSRWLDHYDRMVRKLYQKDGRPMMMDVHRIMRGKYITQ